MKLDELREQIWEVIILVKCVQVSPVYTVFFFIKLNADLFTNFTESKEELNFALANLSEIVSILPSENEEVRKNGM